MIRIGYVGINTELPSASRTFRLAGYTEERMLEVSRSNLLALHDILKWNLEHHITLFRITSGLIPFGSNTVNSGTWKHELKEEFDRVGKYIRQNSMRVSMHPGQYTVLNAPDPNVYRNALLDLEYHNAVLDLMGLDSSHIIIIHGGGAYQDKARYLAVLQERLSGLDKNLKKRIALENDERVYSAEDIFSVCMKTVTPGIFDILHHQVLPSFEETDTRVIIQKFQKTWPGKRQKIHYSNQDPTKNRGAHSETIDLELFGAFLKEIRGLELDIMLEVKDKQVSVLRLRERYPELG